MYIQEVRVILLCENPACVKQLELWPRVRDISSNHLSIDTDTILRAARHKHLIVKDGVVFCSEVCEQASRNQEVKDA